MDTIRGRSIVYDTIRYEYGTIRGRSMEQHRKISTRPRSNLLSGCHHLILVMMRTFDKNEEIDHLKEMVRDRN